MTKTTTIRFGAVTFLVVGIAIGYFAARQGIDVAETANAQSASNGNQSNVGFTSNGKASTLENGDQDPMEKYMPWKTDDPLTLMLNPDDPTLNLWNERRDTSGDPTREAGPIDMQRYKMGWNWQMFPTFFGRPVAFTPEDLRAGDVDVAIVGSTTDNNFVRGTSNAANRLRAAMAYTWAWSAHGGGKQKRTRDGNQNQYTRTFYNELNLVDYGNINAHQFNIDKSAEEIDKVLSEIISADVLPLMVGGSHDNMYGVFLAAARKYGPKNFGIVHFDSHVDMKKMAFGYWNHNANGMYWVLKNGLVEGKDVVQVGLTQHAPTDGDLKFIQDNDVRYHLQPEIERDGWETVMKRVLEDLKDVENIVVTVDIDVMPGAFVPGTGAREPDGPTPAEMNQAMRALAIAKNVIAVDICEFNPTLDDKAENTAVVVEWLMRHFLAGLAARKRGITDPFYYHPDAVDDGK